MDQLIRINVRKIKELYLKLREKICKKTVYNLKRKVFYLQDRTLKRKM